MYMCVYAYRWQRSGWATLAAPSACTFAGGTPTIGSPMYVCMYVCRRIEIDRSIDGQIHSYMD